MECFRCLRKAGVATVTPLGGVLLCEECVEVILKKTVAEKPIYFGRCFRDAFRLCLPDCSHLMLGQPVDRNGEMRIESAICNASSESYERPNQEGGIIVSSFPVNLRRRTTDEYLAALLLTMRSEDLQAVAEMKVKETKEVVKDEEEKNDDLGGYREGDM